MKWFQNLQPITLAAGTNRIHGDALEKGSKVVKLIRSHLKKRILVQDQGGAEFQTAGILKYVEDLKRGINAEIGPKDFFEIASNRYIRRSNFRTFNRV